MKILGKPIIIMMSTLFLAAQAPFIGIAVGSDSVTCEGQGVAWFDGDGAPSMVFLGPLPGNICKEIKSNDPDAGENIKAAFAYLDLKDGAVKVQLWTDAVVANPYDANPLIVGPTGECVKTCRIDSNGGVLFENPPSAALFNSALSADREETLLSAISATEETFQGGRQDAIMRAIITNHAETRADNGGMLSNASARASQQPFGCAISIDCPMNRGVEHGGERVASVKQHYPGGRIYREENYDEAGNPLSAYEYYDTEESAPKTTTTWFYANGEKEYRYYSESGNLLIYQRLTFDPAGREPETIIEQRCYPRDDEYFNPDNLIYWYTPQGTACFYSYDYAGHTSILEREARAQAGEVAVSEDGVITVNVKEEALAKTTTYTMSRHDAKLKLQTDSHNPLSY